MTNNGNKTIVVNGSIMETNISDLLDITNAKQIKAFNEERKKRFKPSFYCGFTIKSFGLGNVIDKITTYTGIKKIIKLIFKECGCEKRGIYFNKWNVYIPYFFIKLNLKSSIKDIEPVPMTQIKLSEPSADDIKNIKIPRSMVKKSNSGCGCNKKFNK